MSLEAALTALVRRNKSQLAPEAWETVLQNLAVPSPRRNAAGQAPASAAR